MANIRNIKCYVLPVKRKVITQKTQALNALQNLLQQKQRGRILKHNQTKAAQRLKKDWVSLEVQWYITKTKNDYQSRIH